MLGRRSIHPNEKMVPKFAGPSKANMAEKLAFFNTSSLQTAHVMTDEGSSEPGFPSILLVVSMQLLDFKSPWSPSIVDGPDKYLEKFSEKYKVNMSPLFVPSESVCILLDCSLSGPAGLVCIPVACWSQQACWVVVHPA